MKTSLEKHIIETLKKDAEFCKHVIDELEDSLEGKRREPSEQLDRLNEMYDKMRAIIAILKRLGE